MSESCLQSGTYVPKGWLGLFGQAVKEVGTEVSRSGDWYASVRYMDGTYGIVRSYERFRRNGLQLVYFQQIIPSDPAVMSIIKRAREMPAIKNAYSPDTLLLRVVGKDEDLLSEAQLCDYDVELGIGSNRGFAKFTRTSRAQYA
ncbi:MAG: hypothetical protein WC050_03350 [Candidatus Paceibacterota bacterium]